MMYLLFVLYSNMLLGAIGIFLSANKKTSDQKKHLWKRFAIYIGIVHLMVYSCWINKPIYLFIILLIAAVGAYEIYNLGKLKKQLSSTSLILYLLITIGFVKFNYKADYRDIIILFCLIVIFDGFSQIFGHLFGSRQISVISPNKTYEGFFGGLVVAISTYAILTKVITTSIPISIMALVLISGFIGDMLASYYKRLVGAKDYSNLIPTHGGVLDRFDSYILASSVMAIF